MTIAVQRRLLTMALAASKADTTKAVQAVPLQERRKRLTVHQRGSLQRHDPHKLHPRWWCPRCQQGPEEGEQVAAWLERAGQCGGAVQVDFHQNRALRFDQQLKSAGLDI